MATKFLTMIKSNDEFDKVLLDCYLKHGYKLVKIGSGNYILNPHRFNPNHHLTIEESLKVFEYTS